MIGMYYQFSTFQYIHCLMPFNIDIGRGNHENEVGVSTARSSYWNYVQVVSKVLSLISSSLLLPISLRIVQISHRDAMQNMDFAFPNFPSLLSPSHHQCEDTALVELQIIRTRLLSHHASLLGVNLYTTNNLELDERLGSGIEPRSAQELDTLTIKSHHLTSFRILKKGTVKHTALWEENSVLEYSNMLNSSKYYYLAIWHIKRFTTSFLERWLTIFLIQHI